MADHHSLAVFVLELLKHIDVGTYLVLDGRLEHLSRSFPDDLFQHIVLLCCLIFSSDRFIILHGRILPPLLATGDLLRFLGLNRIRLHIAHQQLLVIPHLYSLGSRNR